jgi:hypothetical protein
MTPEARLSQISQTLEAVRSGWPSFLSVLQEKADRLTLDLIGQDNEQTRGRIKQLRELMELPEALQQERDGINAGLAE